MKKQDIIECTKEALKKIYVQDSYLIANKASERAIVSHFAHYLEEELLKNDQHLRINVDVEYNRNQQEPKKISGKQVVVDVVLHERGTHKQNIVAIEVKPYWSRKKEREKDKEKIKSLVRDYDYKYGMTILLGKEEAEGFILPQGESDFIRVI